MNFGEAELVSTQYAIPVYSCTCLGSEEYTFVPQSVPKGHKLRHVPVFLFSIPQEARKSLIWKLRLDAVAAGAVDDSMCWWSWN